MPEENKDKLVTIPSKLFDEANNFVKNNPDFNSMNDFIVRSIAAYLKLLTQQTIDGRTPDTFFLPLKLKKYELELLTNHCEENGYREVTDFFTATISILDDAGKSYAGRFGSWIILNRFKPWKKAQEEMYQEMDKNNID